MPPLPEMRSAGLEDREHGKESCQHFNVFTPATKQFFSPLKKKMLSRSLRRRCRVARLPVAAVCREDVLHGQVLIHRLPMDAQPPANELPFGPLGGRCRLEARKVRDRHAHLLSVGKRNGEQIAGKGYGADA